MKTITHDEAKGIAEYAVPYLHPIDTKRLLSYIAKAEANELERGNIMGRIAIALYPGADNITDEQCVTGVQAMALELANLKRAGDCFDADIVELFARCQRGEMTCIYAAEVVKGKMSANEARDVSLPEAIAALEDAESDLACYENDPKYPAKNSTLKTVRAALTALKGE